MAFFPWNNPPEKSNLLFSSVYLFNHGWIPVPYKLPCPFHKGLCADAGCPNPFILNIQAYILVC